MKTIIKLTCLFFCLGTVNSLAQSGGQDINKNKSNVALQGYDPVSYFSDKPSEGSEKFTATWKGVNYWFKNEANKDQFLKNPSKYEPKYGGWCAYAMSIDGSKVKVDPETYKILDGGLYLFYNFRSTNTLPKWNDDEANLKSKADGFWDEVLD